MADVSLGYRMCSRVFVVVYMGLILATAGFCLTIAGWFTPSTNENISVHGVRRAGPVLLVLGVVLLIGSCLMCAVAQNRCCDQCVSCYHDSRKQVLQRHLARTVSELQHTTDNHVISSNQVVLNDIQQPCQECSLARADYLMYMPPGGDLNPQHIHQNHSHSNYAREQSANQSPRFQRILQMDQSRSSPQSCGYHESDGTTDSAGTPSTIPIHNQTIVNPSPVILKQLRSHIPRHDVRRNMNNRASTSGAPPSMSNPRRAQSRHGVVSRDASREATAFDSPRWVVPRQLNDSTTDDAFQSTPTTSPMLTPASSRKHSDSLIGAAPHEGVTRAGTKLLLAAAKHLPEDPDLVWTPQSSRWGASLATAEDSSPPPPYKHSHRHVPDL